MDKCHHRIEAVRRLYVLGGTGYRRLQHDNRHCGKICRKVLRKEKNPLPAGIKCLNVPSNVLETVGFVFRHKADCFFVSIRILSHCRGPPFLI